MAETVRALLQCDAEELKDTAKRSGVVGYLRAGRSAMMGERTTLEPTKLDPADYDIVVVGTPVWVYTASVPVMTWLRENEKKIGRVAVFCTHGGNPGHVFEDIEAACGVIADARLAVHARKVRNAEHIEEASRFAAEIRGVGEKGAGSA